MCEVLDRLESLTTKLPPVANLSEFRVDCEGVTTYEFDDGVAISENIYSTKDVAIAKTFIPEGTNFNTHIHNINTEWIIILEGVLQIIIETESTVLNKYDSIKIDMAKPHSAIAVEDTTIIAITVPRDEGYPK